jgi:hypothetical protein
MGGPVPAGDQNEQVGTGPDQRDEQGQDDDQRYRHGHLLKIR